MNSERELHASKIIERAKREAQNGEHEVSWKLLEEAHIFSQPYAALHLYVHWEMLSLAIEQGDTREVRSQILRMIFALPASWSGRYPVGNTGRGNVSMFAPMPLPKRISNKIEELSQWD